MNKFYVVLLGISISVMGFISQHAVAEVIYAENFATISDGWSIGTVTQGTISFAAGAESGSPFPTRSLELSHVLDNTTRLISTNPSSSFSISKSSSKTYTFQFDLRVNRADAAGWIIFYDSSNSSQLPMFINVAGGNFVTQYWNDSAEANQSLTLLSGYSVDTTYTFTFTTTPSTGLFSASVTDGTATLVDQMFRRTSGGSDIFSNFNRIQVYNDGGSAKSGSSYDIYIDNILVQQIPEPHTLAILFLSGFAFLALRRIRIFS